MGDGLQRLIRETDQGTAQVNTTLDAQGNTTTYTDPRTLATAYIRNGFGDVKRRTSPDSGITDYVYDLRGLVTQMTDGRGLVRSYSYDTAGRMLAKGFPAAANENVGFVYDSIAGGNIGKGRLTSVTDESGSTAYVYDARGNVLTETRTIAGQVYTAGYQYGLADRVIGITYPSGRIVAYIRDAQGRVTSVTTKQNATAALVTLASGIAWQPFSGLVSAMTYGNGLTEADSYSLDYEVNRLLLQNGTTALIDRTHAHGDLLNLTAITDAVTPANSQTFSYSAANRLSTASGVYGTYGWSYDGVGNRTQETLGAATNVCAYPAASNRLTTITSGATTLRTFTYDPNGNTLSGTRSGTLYAYTYNQNNRLKTVTVAGNLKATYTYNAAEQLAVRVLTNMTPSGTIHDVYDRDGNLLMESNGQSTGITREYIWLPGTEIAPATDARAGVPRPIAVVDAINTASPATWWVHTDHLNRPVQMTDATKASVWQASWLPFGAPQAITGATTLDSRFPGQWFQLESGLVYNWNRHYDPTTGRYTQSDPLGFADGPSVYVYGKSGPLGFTDLRGLIVGARSLQCFGEQHRADGRGQNGHHLRNALNAAEMCSSKNLPPNGEENHSNHSACHAHCDAIKSDVGCSANHWEPCQRTCLHRHTNSHHSLYRPFCGQPTAAEICGQPKHGADDEHAVIGGGVEAALNQDRFIEQRNAGIGEGENGAGKCEDPERRAAQCFAQRKVRPLLI